MRGTLSQVVIVALFCFVCYAYATNINVNAAKAEKPQQGEALSAIDRLVELRKIHEAGFIDKAEFERRKASIIDEATGSKNSNVRVQSSPYNNNTVYSPQVQFLLNIMSFGLPRSYADVLPTSPPQNYWTTSSYLDVGAVDPWMNPVPLDSQIAIQERTLSRYGLNLYDGATWEIALALEGLGAVSDIYERNTLYCSSTGSNANVGGLADIRADSSIYLYGASQIPGDQLAMITLPGNCTRVITQDGQPTQQTTQKQNGAFFYRMIGPFYEMTDPFNGNYGNAWKYPYPDNDTTTPWNVAGVIHWNDWKPITGENVWAAIMGPIQSLWIRNGTNMPEFTTFEAAPAQIQLAISILPALVALQSPMGSLYHCPKGTQMFPPDPNEASNVSNENNFSAYASLKMLQEVLYNKTQGTTDPVLTQAYSDVTNLVQGLDKWFDTYLLSEEYQGYRVVYQGGHVTFAGAYNPVPLNQTGGFAVDCQTWGMTVLGADRVDQVYGAGTAYQVWQATKNFAGYYTEDGQLGGVGYTIVDGDKSHMIWSAEWTWGAIGACKKMAYEYQQMGNAAYATSLLADAQSMESLVTQPIIRCPGNDAWCGGGLVQEDGSYLYANSRFFIPWGWYANPVGATCSTAWAVMNNHKFNPFKLGGGYVSALPDPDPWTFNGQMH